MLFSVKIWKKLLSLPLFFQVFGLACIFMFVVCIYSFISDFYKEGRIFLYTGLTGSLVFSLVILATSNRDLKETGFSQLLSLILSFLLLPLFLAIPNWIILPETNMIDSYLDMVSAFTTTGLTIFENDFLTKSIHLWRAIVAWFGGCLVWIAAFVILLPTSGSGFEVFSNAKVFNAGDRKLTLDERSITLVKVSRKLIPIYIALTLILWSILTILGTDGYTSLIRALSIVSTSGISGPDSFASDGAGFLGELVIILFLFFALSNNVLGILNQKLKMKSLSLDSEVRLGLALILIVTGLISLKQIAEFIFYNNELGSFENIVKIIWGNFFTIFSFITTNGYVSSYWNFISSQDDISYISILLIGLCLFGGGLATTAGGIKLLRISILFSAFSNETGKMLNPSIIEKNRQNNNFDISIFVAWIFFMLFLVSLAILTVFLATFEILFADALILAVACLTTTGPIIEVIGLETYLISDLSFTSKIALVVGMALGRLEILVAISLITFGFNRD